MRIVVLLLMLLGACSKTLPPPAPPTEVPMDEILPDEAPAWTHVKTQTINRDGARFVQAVGVARDINNVALLKTTAENRARAELARYLGQSTINGAQIVNTWQDPKTSLWIAQVEVRLGSEGVRQ